MVILMAELKPCPFCGGEAKVHICDGAGMYHNSPERGNVLFGRHLTHKMILCNKCGIRTKAYATDRGVFNAWNRRAGDTNGE